MEKKKINLDRVAFLYLLDSLTEIMGPDMAKGILQRVGQTIANRMIAKFSEESLNVNSIEDLKDTANPLTFFESLEEYGDNLIIKNDQLFILEKCPFGKLLAEFIEINQEIPAVLSEIVNIYNSEGIGYAVSPFCIIHQTFRNEISQHIQINKKPAEFLHLACKAKSGIINFASENIRSKSLTDDEIKQILETAACIYFLSEKE